MSDNPQPQWPNACHLCAGCCNWPAIIVAKVKALFGKAK